MRPRTLHTYTVVPCLPERLAPLRELAYNLRWSWDHATLSLFRDLGGKLWEESGHNPARLLGMVSQERLSEAAIDPAFLDRLQTVYAEFRRYMNADKPDSKPENRSWWGKTYGGELAPPQNGDFRIAYFSAEFGITECLPIYSGGLGVLAGDHLKSASDLGLPLVGVGFLYQRGYFRQSLNADGWQIENYPVTDFYSLPIQPVTDANDDSRPLVIGVDFPGRTVHAQVWKAQVGRVSLFLLDTNLSQNAEADRHIAGNLYGGDNETRMQQEIVLGIGGIHALFAMGIFPTVCHMNEGHSAFLALERVRRLVEEKGLSFAAAAEAAGAGNLFTTHTPVPAGFDIFPEPLMRKYLEHYANRLGLSVPELIDRGRMRPGDTHENFNMAAFAFRHARYINGVSRLHGEVTRRMVQPAWSGFPESEVPVGYVTNGIHTRSFLSHEMAELLDEYLGPRWHEDPSDPAIWARVDAIPDAQLWLVREKRRAKLVNWARQHQVGKYEKRGASDQEVADAGEILDPHALTIGFARRFATYKRGNLLLRDVERLKKIVNDPARPVQFVFAGKAHPRDDAGKELIKQIIHFSKGQDVYRRFVFLEDYDLAMARYLVEGVDVWLNNPRRPMEASGTSGMKVIANGGLNFSVLDGWWAEGYDSHVGWSIGRGEDYDDYGYQDHVEALDIYETLEREIVPLFYDRSETYGLPHSWIAKMKASMKKLAPVFTTHRMVREYTEKYYVPAARRAELLAQNEFARAKAILEWKRKIQERWGDVRVESVSTNTDKIQAGQQAVVQADVRLGDTLTPDDVAVQLYAGPVDADRSFVDTRIYPLSVSANGENGLYHYTGALPSERSGQQGFTVRVVPSHPDAVLPQELPLITWE